MHSIIVEFQELKQKEFEILNTTNGRGTDLINKALYQQLG